MAEGGLSWLPAMPEGSVLLVGIDLVHVPEVEASLRGLGARYVSRLFTEDEAAYARSAPTQLAARLAARFAAKEAALKAFGWAALGVNLRDIEVCRASDGACQLRLHGRAAELIEAAALSSISLSLSHDGDYATAIVVALRRLRPTAT